MFSIGKSFVLQSEAVLALGLEKRGKMYDEVRLETYAVCRAWCCLSPCTAIAATTWNETACAKPLQTRIVTEFTTISAAIARCIVFKIQEHASYYTPLMGELETIKLCASRGAFLVNLEQAKEESRILHAETESLSKDRKAA